MQAGWAILIWGGLTVALVVPLGAAALSPLLAWRDPVYIAAGFAGIVALCLMLVQPLLIRAWLPGLTPPRARRGHRLVGQVLTGCVLLHVAGLWITSPPDVIDVLLFRSPTPFGVWGAIALWSVLATALLALLRTRWPLLRRWWRGAHGLLTFAVVTATLAHVLLIEGTMEPRTKLALCGLVIAGIAAALLSLVTGARRRSGAR
jgi:hypothetical protein